VREEEERSLVGGHGNFITIADQIKKFPAPWQRAESRVAEDTTTIIAAAAATHILHTRCAPLSQGSIEASKASSFHTLNGVANSLRQSVRARLLGASRITPFINATHNLMAAALWGITFFLMPPVCVTDAAASAADLRSNKSSPRHECDSHLLPK
jgi:hypothetical protein